MEGIMKKITINSILIGLVPAVIMVVMIYLFAGDIIFAIGVSAPLAITLAVASYEQKTVGAYVGKRPLMKLRATAWLGLGLFLCLLLLIFILKP